MAHILKYSILTYRYQLMLSCWLTLPGQRPTFSNLSCILDEMLLDCSQLDYLDLQVNRDNLCYTIPAIEHSQQHTIPALSPGNVEDTIDIVPYHTRYFGDPDQVLEAKTLLDRIDLSCQLSYLGSEAEDSAGVFVSCPQEHCPDIKSKCQKRISPLSSVSTNSSCDQEAFNEIDDIHGQSKVIIIDEKRNETNWKLKTSNELVINLVVPDSCEDSDDPVSCSGNIDGLGISSESEDEDDNYLADISHTICDVHSVEVSVDPGSDNGNEEEDDIMKQKSHSEPMQRPFSSRLVHKDSGMYEHEDFNLCIHQSDTSNHCRCTDFSPLLQIPAYSFREHRDSGLDCSSISNGYTSPNSSPRTVSSRGSYKESMTGPNDDVFLGYDFDESCSDSDARMACIESASVCQFCGKMQLMADTTVQLGIKGLKDNVDTLSNCNVDGDFDTNMTQDSNKSDWVAPLNIPLSMKLSDINCRNGCSYYHSSACKVEDETRDTYL